MSGTAEDAPEQDAVVVDLAICQRSAWQFAWWCRLVDDPKSQPTGGTEEYEAGGGFSAPPRYDEPFESLRGERA